MWDTFAYISALWFSALQENNKDKVQCQSITYMLQDDLKFIYCNRLQYICMYVLNMSVHTCMYTV